MLIKTPEEKKKLSALATSNQKAKEKSMVKDEPVFPKKKITCNCKKSRCLKLYCECFAAGEVCRDCNCIDCANIEDNEEERLAKMMQLMERNPTAFKPKINFKEASPREVFSFVSQT